MTRFLLDFCGRKQKMSLGVGVVDKCYSADVGQHFFVNPNGLTSVLATMQRVKNMFNEVFRL